MDRWVPSFHEENLLSWLVVVDPAWPHRKVLRTSHGRDDERHHHHHHRCRRHCHHHHHQDYRYHHRHHRFYRVLTISTLQPINLK